MAILALNSFTSDLDTMCNFGFQMFSYIKLLNRIASECHKKQCCPNVWWGFSIKTGEFGHHFTHLTWTLEVLISSIVCIEIENWRKWSGKWKKSIEVWQSVFFFFLIRAFLVDIVKFKATLLKDIQCVQDTNKCPSFCWPQMWLSLGIWRAPIGFIELNILVEMVCIKIWTRLCKEHHSSRNTGSTGWEGWGRVLGEHQIGHWLNLM